MTASTLESVGSQVYTGNDALHRVDRCLRCDDDHAIRTALDAYGRMREQPAKDFCAALRADIANVKTKSALQL